MPTDQEYARQRGGASAARDYRLYAASQDPVVGAGSNFLNEKFGLARDIGEILIMALQQMMGMQNGAATLAGVVQGSVGQLGIPAIRMNNGYAGTLSGGSIAALDSARQMTEAIQGHFYQQNGMPRDVARGLNQSEVAAIVSQVMQTGMQFQFGPLQQRETLSQERLTQLRDDARGKRDFSTLRELEGARAGDLMTTFDTEGMRKFNKYLEKAVDVVKGVKEITGSQSLQELDALTQNIFGMTIPEFGLENAQRVIGRVRAAGVTHFGGDSKMALSHMMVGSQSLVGNLAANMGMNPADPEVMRSLTPLALQMNYRYAYAGVHGSKDSMRSAGAAASRSGVGMRSRSAEEIQTTISEDLATITAQEKELLAAAHFEQTAGAGLDPYARKELADARRRLAEAGTDEEIMNARANLASVFSKYSGESVGSYLGTPAQTARIMSSLTAGTMAGLAADVGGAYGSRMRGGLKDKFSRDSYLRSTLGGMTTGEIGTLGLGVSNLSAEQFSRLASVFDAGGDIGAFLRNPDNQEIRRTLEAAGVGDIDKFANLFMEGGVDAANVMRAKVGQFAPGFVSEGSRRKAARDELRDFMATHQAGAAQDRGDAVTEFIKGFLGGTEIRGGTLVARGLANGANVQSVAMTNAGEIAMTDANLKVLKGNTNVQELARRKGWVKGNGDIDWEKFEAAAKDPANQREIRDALTSGGAFRFEGGRLEFLSEKDALAASRSIQEEADADALNAINAWNGITDDQVAEEKKKYLSAVKRRDGESDAEYNERVQGMYTRAFENMVDRKGGAKNIAMEIARDKDGTMARKLSVALRKGDVTAVDRKAMLDAIMSEEDRLEKGKNKEVKAETWSDEDNKAYQDSIRRLGRMREELERGDGRKERVSHMTVTHMTVQQQRPMGDVNKGK